MEKFVFKLFFLLLLPFSLMGADESVGKIIALEGTVKAITQEQKERALSKGALIYVMETVEVAENSRAQIRFTDGTLLNLNPDSSLQMSAYSYKQNGQPDQFGADLSKGSFRFLTGSIAKKNPDEYEMRTPTASLGLRGTIVTINILGEKVYFGVEEGRAVVSNSMGSILIGEGEKASFSLAEKNALPVPIKQRPQELNPRLFTPANGAISFPQKSAPAPSKAPSHASPQESDMPKTGGGSAQIHGGC